MYLRNIIYTILILLIWISVCSAQTNRQSYISWLQKNHAWEILNNKLDSLSPTPENVLTRANYLMRMHKFDNSLKILDKYGKFSNNALESKRLFLKAKINRQQRKHFLALQNYFSAAKVVSPQKYSEELKKHSDVKWYCKTVAKKYFWENYSGGPANKNFDMWFLNSLRLAPDILPGDIFWQDLNQLLIQNNAKVDSPTQSTENCLSISQATRNNTVQSLLASAMGDMGKGRDLLLSVESDEVRYMWSEIFSRVFDQNFELNMDKNKDKLDLKGLYPKYRAFEDYIYPLLDKQSAKDWMLKQPRTSSWINFRSDISSLDNKKKALDKIRKELNSTFLNPKLEKVLQKYAFGYAVLADKYSLAQQLWENIESENKCFSLQVAGFVLGFSSSLSQNKKVNRFPNFNQLAIIVKNSLYTASVCKLITPFWIKEFKGKYSKVATNFPLDFLANYSLHKQKWSKKHSVQLGKTITLLYPFSLLKNRACMWLAKRAHKNKQVDKAWGYLGELDDSIQNSKLKKDYLKAKAGLLMEKDRKRKSIKVYKKLLSKYPHSLGAEKKLNLAVLSQREDNWQWAENILLDLWEDRQGLSSQLKAEILFWLGESAEKKGLVQKAKDYYFRLAWRYPQENMWAVTALHRAALICRDQGQLFTAKNMLQKVKKIAEQKSQKKQAEDVLSSIEKKLEQDKETTPVLLY